MIQMQRKLKIEGRGRNQAFIEEVENQFAQVLDTMTLRPRQNSLKLFSWRLFEAVSNHFCPGSVRPADMPANIREKSKPFVNLCLFRAVDTSVLSLEEIILFIQSNGDESFRWPRKPKSVVRREQRIKLQLKRFGNSGYDLTIPSAQSTTRHRSIKSRASPSAHRTPDGDPRSRAILWDDDIKLETPPPQNLDTMTIARPSVPTLSFSCRLGWDLNKKNIWASTVTIKSEARTVVAAPIADAEHSSIVQPQVLGTALFKQTPQEDIDAFLKRFLGGEKPEGETKQEGQQSV